MTEGPDVLPPDPAPTVADRGHALMRQTKLPLTDRFLAIHLISRAHAGLPALARFGEQDSLRGGRLDEQCWPCLGTFLIKSVNAQHE